MAYTTVDDPEKYFQCKLYTGNGSTQSITFDGTSDMRPDMNWTKVRSETGSHRLTDIIRGLDNPVFPNGNDAEGDEDNYASFDSDGFSLKNESVNENTRTYVSWCWNAAASNAANSDGDIASVVRANTTSGFSIVTYTGNATSGQGVGHGLGIAPKFISIKNRDQNDTWIVFTTGVDGSLDYISNGWGDTNSKGDSGLDVPTTSIFDIHSDAHQNATGEKYVAYCWANVQGFSKIGVYRGNNNSDGPFVYTGFRPAFVMIKDSGSGQYWHIIDNKRDPFNDNAAAQVTANTSSAESAVASDRGALPLDLLSNGFKVLTDGSSCNGTGTFLYMAFAESPFANSKGTPNNAR